MTVIEHFVRDLAGSAQNANRTVELVAASFSDGAVIVSLDALADTVHKAQKAIVELVGSADGGWAGLAATALLDTALPVFNRDTPVTPDAAVIIRTNALTLAIEADSLGEVWLGDTFRRIAAGVTLLERRVSGEAQPTETIILVTG